VPDTEFRATKEFGASQDTRDALASFRKRFHIPKKPDGSDCIYLCGHSGRGSASRRIFMREIPGCRTTKF
jgi:hypothetical protein